MGIQKDYSVYPAEYFSGSDVYIFFNNRIVDQIISIQFNITENIIPIYGYASYTYDAVARGSRIVTGTFRINFVESMYLYTLMDFAANEIYDSESLQASMTSELTSEQISHAIKYGSLSRIQKEIDANEARLWGSADTTPINKYKSPYFTSDASPDLKRNGFDIILSYGDERFNTGQILNDIPSTVKVINGVHLTGVSQVVQPTGEAVFEEYTFIAQDTDNTINTRK